MDIVSSRGVVASDPQNNPDPKGFHTRSTFSEKDLGYNFFCTLPFGEVRPFTFFESVPDDKRIRAQFLSQVQSYTLKAPLMQGIHMKKMLCQVPREAILPLSWEKWFKNPVIGQDVPGDVGTSVLGFWHIVYVFMSAMQTALPLNTSITDTVTANAFCNAIFKYFLIAELFYSDGNLMKHCGISGRPWCYSFKSDGYTQNSVDYVFDKFMSVFLTFLNAIGNRVFYLSYGVSPNITTYSVDVNLDPNRTYPGKYINIREMLSLMRDDLTFSIDFGSTTTAEISQFEIMRQVIKNDVELLLVFVDDNPSDPADAVPVDLKRLWAYQLSYAHFLTNDSVDFLFTAELYRQYVWNLVQRVTGYSNTSYTQRFTVNGFVYEYDYLSAHYFVLVLQALTSYFTNGSWPTGAYYPSSLSSALAYLVSCFSFKRSLRYLDYFTGAKTRPLAVGDVNVQVNSNLVNVVDTQAKTFLARFLNVINRSGMRKYYEAVFNTKQAPDWHNPQYLVVLDDMVTGQRIENTASEQWTQPNSVTSLLHSQSDRFAFEMDFDRSSIIIGMVWFDIDRVYSMATERQNLHYDRFDEFQPFMQYTGDQALYRVELGTPLTSGGSGVLPTDPFGFKLRNCEYKERFDQCAGGFCGDSLDGYLFKADVMEASGIQNVSPSFIRSFPSELDRFYLSLQGFSLATYYHFIVKFTNLYSGSRPMAYAPTLM